MRLRSASAFLFSASMRLRSASAFCFSASMRLRSASAFFFSASMRLRSASAFFFSASMRLRSASAFFFSASMRLRSASAFCLLRLDALALRLGLLLLRLDALVFGLCLAAGFLGLIHLCPGRLRLLLEPAFLLRLVATLLLEHRKLLVLLVALRGQRRLLLLQSLEPSRLRFALAREIREPIRLLAFPFALGCHVLALALALQPLELLKPAFLLGAPALGGVGLPLQLLDPLAFRLASLLVLLAQTLQLFGDLLLVDDHGLDRLGPGAAHDRRWCVPEPEDEHRRDDGVEYQRVEDGQQPIEQ